MDPDSSSFLTAEVWQALSVIVDINNDYVQSLVRALFHPDSSVERRLAALVAFVGYAIHYSKGTVHDHTADADNADNANNVQLQVDEGASSSKKPKSKTKFFVCDLCHTKVLSGSGKRHLEEHRIRYICLWCLQVAREVREIRYERLWEKHIFLKHRGKLRDDDEANQPRALADWCALECTICGMRFAIQHGFDSNKAALREPKRSLVTHYRWHRQDASRNGWMSRVALNGLLLQERLVKIWNNLMERFGLDGSDVIAGLPEACAKACAKVLARPMAPIEIYGHLCWLAWAGTVRYDAAKAENIERPALSGHLTDYQVTLSDVADQLGDMAEDPSLQSAMLLSPPPGPGTYRSTLTSMSELNEDTTIDDMQTDPTDPIIGAHDQPEAESTRATHGHFAMPQTSDPSVDATELDGLMYMDEASTINNLDAGMAGVTYVHPWYDAELLPPGWNLD